MSVSKVILQAAENYDQPVIDKIVCEIFSQFGDQINISRGDSVLIKPNFIAPKPLEIGAATHPSLLIAIAKIVKDIGGKPFVADSPAWSDTYKCLEVFGYADEFKKLGIAVGHLDQTVRKAVDGQWVGISKTALDADKIVNVPKFKSHQQLGATFAIKNMYGCIPGKEKAIWHFLKGKDYDKFCRMVIDIYKRLAPVISIIDGITAMEGKGPLSGTPRQLGAIVAGTDPVACERVCAEVGCFDIESLPLFKMAVDSNLGCGDLDRIEVIGDTIDNLRCPDFIHPQQIPLHFTFSHICKSLIKQIVLIAGNLHRRGSTPSR